MAGEIRPGATNETGNSVPTVEFDEQIKQYSTQDLVTLGQVLMRGLDGEKLLAFFSGVKSGLRSRAHMQNEHGDFLAGMQQEIEQAVDRRKHLITGIKQGLE